MQRAEGRCSAPRLEAAGFSQALLEVVQDLQRRGNVMVLVTSRIALPGGLGGARQLHLQALADGPALELLSLWAGDFSTKLTRQRAAALAQDCSGNARLLTIVGGLINCSPSQDHSEVLAIITFAARCRAP